MKLVQLYKQVQKQQVDRVQLVGLSRLWLHEEPMDCLRSDTPRLLFAMPA